MAKSFPQPDPLFTMHHSSSPQESLSSAQENNSSWFFFLGLRLFNLFRRPYLWLRRRWPQFFDKHLEPEVALDTSSMLEKFNWLHRCFFRKGFDSIRFDESDLQWLSKAQAQGPIIFLMSHWGQVEYNYFNYLFLKHQIPRVTHNNRIKMAHWMPHRQRKAILRQKIDRFFTTGHWPFNEELFSLENALASNQSVLYCLDLPKATEWMEYDFTLQEQWIQHCLKTQEKIGKNIQWVPLNFLYDKHPEREQQSLGEILFGEKQHPGYLKKILLFLRSYKKRAVAKIGMPLDLKTLSLSCPEPQDLLKKLQEAFEAETRHVTGPKLKSRHQVIEEILRRPSMLEKLSQISLDSGLSSEEIEQRLRTHLYEIASDLNFTTIELWNYFLHWLFHRFYDGLKVDQVGLAQIKQVARKGPIILVPSHKSHVDYLLLSYVFYRNDLSLPHICAGTNLNFWPLGSVFRRSGAYFIRRSLSGDPLYSLALKSYVAQLMEDGFFQEFFIEGTRSRSGKIFPPKLGLLKMIVETYQEMPQDKDLHFIPVSLDYEKVLEEGSYLEEVKGAQKQGERLKDLLHLPKFLSRRYGKVYVQFGTPLSLQKELQQASQKNLSPSSEPQLATHSSSKANDFSTQVTVDLAWKLGNSIQKASTLLPSPWVALALLTPKENAFILSTLETRCHALLEILRRLHPRRSELIEEDPQSALHKSLEYFQKQGWVLLHQGLEENFYTLPEETRLNLNYYKNSALPFLAGLALKMRSQQRFRNDTAAAERCFSQGKKLLEREFYFEAFPSEGDTKNLPPWIPEILDPLLESYRITLEALEHIPFRKMEEWLLLRKILERGKLLLLRGKIQYPESLNRFAIQNALHRFLELGLLQDHSKEMGPQGKKYLSSLSAPEEKSELNKLLNEDLIPQAPNPIPQEATGPCA